MAFFGRLVVLAGSIGGVAASVEAQTNMGWPFPCADDGQTCEGYYSQIVRNESTGDYAYKWFDAIGGELLSPPFQSSAWHSIITPYLDEDFQIDMDVVKLVPSAPLGSRLNINLLAAPSPGDFLPPARTLGESSLALLPPGSADTRTGWQDAERQTLDGAVDLVTGLPLVRVTDLELPFDGATFRLTRTRSGNRQDLTAPDEVADLLSASNRWWDWTGLGWMVGENPLLLIDSALPDVVGDNPVTCYLILDAHHSIPFQRIENSGLYAAPPRFRATLTHNGKNWDPAARDWETPPTQFEVSLYEGAVTYTFAAIYEDVPPNLWNKEYIDNDGGGADWVESSYHDRPFTPNQFFQIDSSATDGPAFDHDPYSHTNNPGFGIPYYALCTRIEDAYGHVAEIEYCRNVLRELDNPNDPKPCYNADCLQCLQLSPAKGRIKSIRLRSPNPDTGVLETAWTLLYAHRMFREIKFYEASFLGTPDEWISYNYPLESNQDIYEYHGFAAIDRIYVYEGEALDDEDGTDDVCLTSHHLDQTSLSFDGGPDPIDVYNETSEPDLPTDYRYVVRYHYRTEEEKPGELGPHSPPLLLKTTVRTIPEGATSDEETVRTTVYKYGTSNTQPPLENPWFPSLDEEAHIPWLEMIFFDEDIRRLLSGDVELFDDVGNAKELSGEFTVDDLANENYSSDVGQAIARFASMRWDKGYYNFGWPTSENKHMPLPDVLYDDWEYGPYLLNEKEKVFKDTHKHVVGAASVRRADGSMGHYRVHRLILTPNGYQVPSGDPFHLDQPDWINGTFDPIPMRSVFAHPYIWHAYMPHSPNPDRALTYAPDLTQARWIAIVDEFVSRAAAASIYDPATGINYDSEKYTGSAGIKKGQLSRRIVEMSPSGYVLRERKWEFSPEGEVLSKTGSGLGEQFIYDKVVDYFDPGLLPEFDPDMEYDVDNDGVDLDGDGTPDGVLHPIDIDAYENVRQELLLIERRSVGWSAAELQGGGVEDTNGLIHFFEYELFGTLETPEEEIPWTTRVQESARGIKRGLDGTLLYTSQTMRNPDCPTNVLARIEFHEPGGSTSLLNAVPGYAAIPSLDMSITRIDTVRDDSDPDIPMTERPILSRMVVGPPHQVRPGSAWYFPVEREWYEDGNSDWSATGELTDPNNPGADAGDPFASLIFTYIDRDSSGRSRHTIIDVNADTSVVAQNGAQVQIPGWPEEGWLRISTTPGPENATTSFEYDNGAPGLSDVYYPNGRRWARRVIKIAPPEPPPGEDDPGAEPEPFAREFIFNDVEAVDGGILIAQSPGQVKDYRGEEPIGAPKVDRRVEFTPNPGPDEQVGQVTLDFSESTQPAWEEYWQLEIGIDANGRLQDATLLEPDPAGAMLAVGTQEVNDLGELYRSREIDGTITTNTRNSIGQVLRTYVGTLDDNWFGGTGDNMVLVSRAEYGSGINDAWQPTVFRRYTSHPAWADDHFGEPGELDDTTGMYVDDDGFATVTSYDWRMRPVRVDTYAQGDPFSSAPPERLSTTLTYLDHADRPRLVVEFGTGELGDLGALDPAALVDADPIPSVTSFYSLPLTPVSITETSYGPDGQQTERRSYDVAWDGSGTGPEYQAEITFAGRGGAQIYARRPGQATIVTRLDSLGRVASTASIRPTPARRNTSSPARTTRTTGTATSSTRRRGPASSTTESASSGRPTPCARARSVGTTPRSASSRRPTWAPRIRTGGSCTHRRSTCASMNPE